jgi:hypothetical protein
LHAFVADLAAPLVSGFRDRSWWPIREADGVMGLLAAASSGLASPMFAPSHPIECASTTGHAGLESESRWIMLSACCRFLPRSAVGSGAVPGPIWIENSC